MHIRPAAATDVPALTDLYNHYVVHTPVTFDIAPVSPENRRAWFQAHPETGRHRLLVAEDGDGGLLGYASSSPFKDRQAYETSVETSVYLAPGRTGRGIGAVLYGALFDALAGEDVHRAYAGIAQPNAASMRLHERFGFRPAGLLQQVGRKFDQYWDVAMLEKRFGER
ncbi:N-acetyltransferase family protein [Streptomyces sp. NPDC049555]|uniref:GNAT family N-acetyltransferase n=1 Tax=Streptomyces sp. NPDC049555 TaxID=3154930 RepID=UPI003430306E